MKFWTPFQNYLKSKSHELLGYAHQKPNTTQIYSWLGFQKKEKRFQGFCGVLFANNIYLKQILNKKNLIVQFKTIHVSMVTFIHKCVSICWFIAIKPKTPKNSQNEFQWTTKHFFGKIISCTCDLHLKLDILNPLNIFFCQMVKTMNPLPSRPFLQNFKTLKFLYDLVFHQVHSMNIYIHRRGHVFVAQKVWNQLDDFMHSFWMPLKKCNLNIFI